LDLGNTLAALDEDDPMRQTELVASITVTEEEDGKEFIDIGVRFIPFTTCPGRKRDTH